MNLKYDAWQKELQGSFASILAEETQQVGRIDSLGGAVFTSPLSYLLLCNGRVVLCDVLCCVELQQVRCNSTIRARSFPKILPPPSTSSSVPLYVTAGGLHIRGCAAGILPCRYFMCRVRLTFAMFSTSTQPLDHFPRTPVAVIAVIHPARGIQMFQAFKGTRYR